VVATLVACLAAAPAALPQTYKLQSVQVPPEGVAVPIGSGDWPIVEVPTASGCWSL
jgi:hypothetical protein